MPYLPVILILVIALPLIFILPARFFKSLVRIKALKKLEEILFPEGELQKRKVTELFSKLSEGRFSEKGMLDYFMKIKGIQLVNTNLRNNFWIRRYLFSPTLIKLNYFEQVKFYEVFLNYPAETKEDMITNGKRKSNQSKQASPIVSSEIKNIELATLQAASCQE